RETIAKGDKAAAETTYRATVSALDKAIQKGVLHKNTAARYKSRLSARVRALGAK
ncbi:MAG: 30S ribosomal protein S20, partial [Acidobacteria bacterium]